VTFQPVGAVPAELGLLVLLAAAGLVVQQHLQIFTLIATFVWFVPGMALALLDVTLHERGARLRPAWPAFALAAVGYVALYSAAGGSPEPYATRHAMRFAVGVVIMLAIGLVDIRFIARLAWPCYAGGVALLVLVWLERHFALLLFTLGYLAVVIAPAGYGWGDHWGAGYWFVLAPLLINGGVLLLGALGFAQAQRRGW